MTIIWGHNFSPNLFASVPCYCRLPYPWLLLPLDGLPIHEHGHHKENQLAWLPQSLGLSPEGPRDRSQLWPAEDGKHEHHWSTKGNIGCGGHQDIHSKSFKEHFSQDVRHFKHWKRWPYFQRSSRVDNQNIQFFLLHRKSWLRTQKWHNQSFVLSVIELV